MIKNISRQAGGHILFYVLFGIVSALLMTYYLSNTIIHFTTPQQFPINSFERFPLTFLIFPAEIFSFFFTLYFIYNMINGNMKTKAPEPFLNKKQTPVAVLIPVYNEPKEIVANTLNACKKLIWEGGVRIYLLDDSTNEKDKQNMNSLSKKFGCTIIRRKDRIGYKAGNINNAISEKVTEEFFVVLDSDQAPEPEFLEETMDYFTDAKVAFVQTPQHFINIDSPLERAAKLGTSIFYYSQCVSKSRDGALPFCGTNAVVRSSAFKKVKGFSYYTATEDIELGLRINEAGFYGAYVPKILVHGYAPVDYTAYSSQQYRWANGNLAILRESWLKILFGKFSLRHQIHTLFTLGWWVVGITTLIYIIVPILSLFARGTHHTWLPTILLELLFLNVLMGIMTIFASLHNRVDGEKIKFSDAFLQYSLITNSMFIFSKAFFAALFKNYAGFVRTNKSKSNSSIWQLKWNILLSIVCFVFSIYSLYMASIASDVQQIRTYFPTSIWLLFYSIVLGSSIIFIDSSPSVSAATLDRADIQVAANPKRVLA